MLELSVVDQGTAGAANPTVIKIIGCGGGGSSAVNRLIDQGVTGVEFVVLNTDLQALNASRAQKRLAIGQKLTGGLGAGGNPQVGEDAAKEDTEAITNVVKSTDMVIITAGMGGGTGTGSAPVVAQVARESGALTIAIVTTPFDFEGGVRMKNAQEGIRRLREQVDSLIIVPNQQVMKFAKERISFMDAFRMADDVLCQGVRGITEIITVKGAVNVDFADVRAIMKNQGQALLGVGIGEGENRAVEAAQKAISNPMLEMRSIDGAHNLLININAPEDVGMGEIGELVDNIRASAAKDCNIIWGQVLNSDMGDRISVTLIATGFEDEGEPSPAESIKRSAAKHDSSDVMSYGSFDALLKGRPSASAEPKEEKQEEPAQTAAPRRAAAATAATTTGDPGLFDPEPEADAAQDSAKNSAENIMGHALSDKAIPDEYRGRIDDPTTPAVYRKMLSGLSRNIVLNAD